MKYSILALFLVFAVPASAKNCWVHLASAQGLTLSEDVTDNFIAFVRVMHTEHVIGDNYIEQLAKGELTNPLQNQLLSKSDHHIFKDNFQNFLTANLDKNKIVPWAAEFLKAQNAINKNKAATKKQTQDAGVKMQFHRIEPGSFSTQWFDIPHNITLTEPFELMSTSATQKMWRELMGKLPPQHYDGNDYPVINVTWWSVIEFANQLSIKNNLPIAYDLSDIKGWTGEAALGTLRPDDEEKAGEALKVNADNIYLTKGYRLPTVYESIYFTSDRGRSKTRFFTNTDANNIHQYAHYNELLHSTFHPVAELLPFVIDGKKFYDLIGNASEWLHDIGTNCEPLKQGVNPVSVVLDKEKKRHTRLVRWNASYKKLDEINVNGYGWTVLDPTVPPQASLRLVRSLPK